MLQVRYMSGLWNEFCFYVFVVLCCVSYLIYVLLHVCLCVSLYCTYACVCLYTARMPVCVFILHVCLCVSLCLCLCLCVSVYLSICACLCLCVFMCAHLCQKPFVNTFLFSDLLSLSYVTDPSISCIWYPLFILMFFVSSCLFILQIFFTFQMNINLEFTAFFSSFFSL